MWRQPCNHGCFARYSDDALKVFRAPSRQLGTTRRNVPSKLPVTRKDKLRRLEKISPDASLITKQLMNRAETRITKAHDFVMSFWNAERYQQKPNEDGSPPPRPPRVGPNMDSRWWFWNILFALSPAAFIVLWAELYGVPKMKAAYIEAELKKRKLIFGPNYVPQEGEIKYPEDNDPILDRLQRAFYDLSSWFLGMDSVPKQEEPNVHIREPPEGEKAPLLLLMASSKQRQLQSTDARLKEAQEKSDAEKQRQQTPALIDGSRHLATPTDSQQSSTAGTPVKQSPEAQQPSTNEESEETGAEQAAKNDDWRWNELFSRIENIENRLDKQEQRQQNMHDFQWHRLNQSNIQNRGEDQMIKHWESQRQIREPSGISPTEKSVPFWTKPSSQWPSDKSGEPSAQRAEDTSMYSKWKAAVWISLMQNLDAKKEAMEKYGADIMDRAWGFWTEDSKGAKDDGTTHGIGGVTPPPADQNPPQPEGACEESNSHLIPPSSTEFKSVEVNERATSASSPQPATMSEEQATKRDGTSSDNVDLSTTSDAIDKSAPLSLWHRLVGRRT